MRAILAALLCVGQAVAGEPLPGLPESPRILFQGDSITDGNRGRGADLNHVHGHGFVYLLAARIGAGAPGQNATFLNRGVSGHTVLDLAKRWPKDTLELKPDVLSVLIGVNDSSKGVAPEVFERTYDELLTAARAANPKLRLVLCEPFLGAAGSAIDKSPGRREPSPYSSPLFDVWPPSTVRRSSISKRSSTKPRAAPLPLIGSGTASIRPPLATS